MIQRIIVLFTIIVIVKCQEVPIKPNVPFSGSTQFGSWTYYSLNTSAATINYIQIVAKVESGAPFLYISVDKLPTFHNYLWRYEDRKAFNVADYIFLPDTISATGEINKGVIYIGVYGYSSTNYTITLNAPGPVALYDRKALSMDFPATNCSYFYYDFTVATDVRRFQVLVEAGDADYQKRPIFLVNNSTTKYPTSVNGPRWHSTEKYTGSGWNSCLEVNYPTPGTYHLTFWSKQRPYKIQFVQNNVQSCGNLSILHILH